MNPCYSHQTLNLIVPFCFFLKYIFVTNKHELLLSCNLWRQIFFAYMFLISVNFFWQHSEEPYIVCLLWVHCFFIDNLQCFLFCFCFCVCYLHMQMQTLRRAVEISISTSYNASVKIFFYGGLTEVFIASSFCD